MSENNNKITSSDDPKIADVSNVIRTTSSKEDKFISFDDWFSAEEITNDISLELLKFGQQPHFLQIFTKQGTDATVHYLQPDDVLPRGGFCHCLGDNCPACRAMVTKKKILLLPVGDLIQGGIKIIRIPIEKGPGQLATELGKVFALNDPSAVNTMITRARNYKYSVVIQAAGEFHSDIAEAAKRFQKNINDGVINISDAIGTLSAEEMAAHGDIARKLKLVGTA